MNGPNKLEHLTLGVSLAYLFVYSKDRAYLSGASKVFLWLLLALPASIRLGWKGLPHTNTLAYSAYL
jgi:hypothetical protein